MAYELPTIEKDNIPLGAYISMNEDELRYLLVKPKPDIIGKIVILSRPGLHPTPVMVDSKGADGLFKVHVPDSNKLAELGLTVSGTYDIDSITKYLKHVGAIHADGSSILSDRIIYILPDTAPVGGRRKAKRKHTTKKRTLKRKASRRRRH
jgi:hypothetical protein